MKFVAKCPDCGEQKILGEWGRCKSCFDKWFTDALNRPDYLTDPDSWFVVDDLRGPQLDPAKVDEAVAACGAAKDAAKMAEDFNLGREKGKPEFAAIGLGPVAVDATFTLKLEEHMRRVQREMNRILRKAIATKDLRYNLGFKNSRKF